MPAPKFDLPSATTEIESPCWRIHALGRSSYPVAVVPELPAESPAGHDYRAVPAPTRPAAHTAEAGTVSAISVLRAPITLQANAFRLPIRTAQNFSRPRGRAWV